LATTEIAVPVAVRTAEDLRPAIATLGASWGMPGLEDWVHVVFSTRLKTSLGRCMPYRGVIRLHDGLRTAPTDLLREVLCHELAHVASVCLHGRHIRPHGHEWGELVRRAGYEPRVQLEVRGFALRRRANGRIYEHRCPICQASRIARRPVQAWRCAMCVAKGWPGRLEIVERARKA